MIHYNGKTIIIYLPVSDLLKKKLIFPTTSEGDMLLPRRPNGLSLFIDLPKSVAEGPAHLL